VVFVSSGLEDVSFGAPSPARGVALENDGHGFRPSPVLIEQGQPVTVCSTDGRLHTVRVRRLDDHSLVEANLAVPPSGEAKGLSLDDRIEGLTTIECAAHGSAERPALLGVFGHPFFAIIGSDGRFQLDHVPAIALELRALRPDGTAATESVTVPLVVPAQGSAQVTLRLP
jgi:hypothetical protein